eukprot:scaffold152234_cov35-Tisochrysis_lutea.AAC.1
MGPSRPPHSIADTPRGGPVQSTINLSPCLLPSGSWQGTGTHQASPARSLVGAGREVHSHARVGPTLELIPPPIPGRQARC